MLTVPRENQFFVYAVFWFFEASSGLLGFILVSLGRIWYQNGIPNGSIIFQKVIRKLSKKSSENEMILGAKMGAKYMEDRDRRLKAFSTRMSKLSFVFFIVLCRFWSSLGTSWEPLWVS